MAIIKDIPTKFGITANYHRLDRFEFNANTRELNLWVKVYANQQAREENKEPLYIEQVVVPWYRLDKDCRDIFYSILMAYDNSAFFGGTSDTQNTQSPYFEVVPLISPPLPPPPQFT